MNAHVTQRVFVPHDGVAQQSTILMALSVVLNLGTQPYELWGFVRLAAIPIPIGMIDGPGATLTNLRWDSVLSRKVELMRVQQLSIFAWVVYCCRHLGVCVPGFASPSLMWRFPDLIRAFREDLRLPHSYPTNAWRRPEAPLGAAPISVSPGWGLAA
jgi:hypothetical protein